MPPEPRMEQDLLNLAQGKGKRLSAIDCLIVPPTLKHVTSTIVKTHATDFISHQAPRFWGSVSHPCKSHYQAAYITLPGLTSGSFTQSKRKLVYDLVNYPYLHCKYKQNGSSPAGLGQ